MLKRQLIIFKILFFLLISISISKAELLKPNSTINPSDVVRIQLTGLQQNDANFNDSGIEQTWNFAHPNNKKVTGPLDNFKRMLEHSLKIIQRTSHFLVIRVSKIPSLLNTTIIKISIILLESC